MGRPKKPENMRAVHGETHKGGPDLARPVKTRLQTLEKPENLAGPAAVEWEKLVKTLADLNVLDRTDANLIRQYAETAARRAECIRQTALLPEMFVTNPNGSIGLHPLFKMIDKTSDQLARWGEMLFLSPASRVRHGLTEPLTPSADEAFGEELRRHAMSRPEVPKVEPLKIVNGDEETEE